MSTTSGIKDFYRGDTRKYKFVLTDKTTGNPVSVEGGKLTATFKKSLDTPDTEAEIQVISMGHEADPMNPTGVIELILTSTDTAVDPDSYYYDFQFTSASGDVSTVLPKAGDKTKVKIYQDATLTP